MKFDAQRSKGYVAETTNYDKQESAMLHTKFRQNRSTGSGEDFE